MPLSALGWCFVFAVPCLALTTLVLPVYDWLFPWRDAVIALKAEEHFSGRLMVGLVDISEGGGLVPVPYKEFRKRVYVLIPNVLWDPSTYQYAEGTGLPGTLRKRPHDALSYLLIDATAIGFSIFVSYPKIRRLIRERKAAAGPQSS